MRTRVSYLIIALALIALGWYGHTVHHARKEHSQTVRQVKAPFNGTSRLTSPLLDVELPEGLNVRHEPMPFKYKVIDLTKQMAANPRISHISVYFRSLVEGPWFGINEKQEFNPASMMKVPVMIAWLKRAEKNPAVLKQRFVFDGRMDMSDQQIHKPARTLEKGSSYSVEKLLEYMMSYSDNNATSILYNNLTPEELNRVLDNMDITNKPNEINNSTTVHGYSGFFRILYNASFLNREMSEKALQMLSREDFPQGISGGVPKGVTVAAKFGEYGEENGNKEKQLHEFGIVYHPKGPYILGIMTKGSDFNLQADVIKAISALVYNEVEAATALRGE